MLSCTARQRNLKSEFRSQQLMELDGCHAMSPDGCVLVSYQRYDVQVMSL
jgi:hypothetical protein